MTADPAGSLADRRESASARDAGGSSSTSARGASDTSGTFSAPVRLDGATARFSDERSSEQTRRDAVSDENGARSETTREARASRTTGGFDLGAVTADPRGSFGDTRAVSDRSDDTTGPLGSDRGSARSNRSSLGLAAPFRSEGLSGAVTREDAAASERDSARADENGTTRRVESSSSASREALGGRSGAFGGAPSLGLVNGRSGSSEDAFGDRFATRSGDARGAYAFPFFSDGAAVGGDLASADSRSLTESVSDENGTLTRTESDENASHSAPSYTFDGISGDPVGGSSLDQLTRQESSLR
ncbi:hypothetical protein [Intrasporangium sp. YIM S08009]|uniref:hypothetical protein n=1 Tax=Intrasporangium zincisolvens TaxID=3080018 RepID=UPI002B055B19|nr:hypothetical protein [Intrasporangium sp. YIM S08009]